MSLFHSGLVKDRLLKDAESINISAEEKYLIAYQEFIQYFKKNDTITVHNTIIGISFTYSWMPTILKFQPDKINKATESLNAAKQGNMLSSEDLDVFKACFSNSIVGSSKLLHFINPDKFAIWDSRVYRYIFNQEPHSYRVEKVDTYLEYLSFCKDLTSSTDMISLQKTMEDKVGYKMTSMRAIELVFFYNGGKF